LSEYEVRVYLSLAIEGASEGRKLSTRCGVPRTKVYATLKKLIERGLVFELPEEPRRFAPSSPLEGFEQYLSHYREETSERIISLMESVEVVSSLEATFKKTQSIVKPLKEEVWIVEGRVDIFKRIKELLSQAKKSAIVVTTEEGLLLFYECVGKLLDRLAENGVTVQIGTRINSHNGSLARELNYICKVKNIDIDSPLLYLCVDDRVFFLAKLNPDEVNVGSERDFGVVCYNSTICDLFSLLLPKLVK
jgi:sugar-specific transcriptional regulator TrmB